MSRFVAVARLILVMLALPGLSGAFAEVYPNKPLRLIVSSAPGGGTDTIARILAASLAESLGQPVVVDNRPGASGAIGAALAAKSRPDGYTMLMSATASTVLLPLTRPDLPYSVAREFAPVSLVASTDYILVVHPSLPVKSVKDLITLAKSKPRQITFSSSGKFGLSHLSGELFQRHADVEMRHVAYKGGGPAARAVAAGETSLMFGTVPSVFPYVKAGKLRMVAAASEQRSKSFPDLPTIAETLPGIIVTAWYGLQVPAGTPETIVSKLNADTVKAVASEPVVRLIVASGLEPRTSSPAQFSAYIKDQSTTWGKVVKASGIATR